MKSVNAKYYQPSSMSEPTSYFCFKIFEKKQTQRKLSELASLHEERIKHFNQRMKKKHEQGEQN